MRSVLHEMPCPHARMPRSRSSYQCSCWLIHASPVVGRSRSISKFGHCRENNWGHALEAKVAQPNGNCERRWPASPQHLEGGGAMQVVRDAILKPPYKRKSMYVLVITIVKQIADRCNFCDASKSLVLKIQK